MALSLERDIQPEIIYPDSDGQPMAENTLQFEWIVLIKENLECLFANDPNVFVAGDLLWYPVEGHPEIRVAPDAMVIFGRAKGYRGSYRQWEEGNIAPHVVFEVLSPGNTATEMNRKLQFYDRYGVQEYYIYEPVDNDLSGFQRNGGGQLAVITEIQDWRSPLLKIRFLLTPETLELYYPDGQRFQGMMELRQNWEQVNQQLDQANQQLEQERLRAEQEKQRADYLLAKLRELGVEPESI